MPPTRENRARITSQVLPMAHRVANEAALVTHGTSGPRRARSDPRQAVLTTRCADRIRNPVPAGPWWSKLAPVPGITRISHSGGPRAGVRGARRGRLAQVREDLAHGHGVVDESDDAHLGATPRRMTAIESEPAARKRRFAELSMSPVGRELPVIAALNSTAASRNSGFPRSTPSSLLELPKSGRSNAAAERAPARGAHCRRSASNRGYVSILFGSHGTKPLLCGLGCMYGASANFATKCESAATSANGL